MGMAVKIIPSDTDALTNVCDGTLFAMCNKNYSLWNLCTYSHVTDSRPEKASTGRVSMRFFSRSLQRLKQSERHLKNK
jgi:hypothetical protein